MKVIASLMTVMMMLAMQLTLTFADVGNTFTGGGGGGGDFSFDSSTSGGEPLTLPEVIATFIVIFLVGLIGCFFEKVKKEKEKQMEQVIVQPLQVRDEAFSLQAFKDYVQEVFLQVQEAWASRDMSAVRSFETDSLFNRHQQQLQEFIEKEWYPHLDKQQINEVYIADIYQEAMFEYVIVRLKATVRDFTTNAKGKVVQGDKSELQSRTYRLTFKRHLSVLTEPNQFLSTKFCPNCGAPTNIGAAGACEFCGSVVTTGEHNWVLDNYEAWY